MSEPVAEEVASITPKRRRVAVIAAVSALVIAMIIGVLVVFLADRPSADATVASSSCIAEATARSTSNAAFSSVAVGEAADATALESVLEQYSRNASTQDITDIAPAAVEFFDASSDSYVPGTFLVSAAVDENSTRRYLLCFVGVKSGAITHDPVAIFTTAN